MTNTKDKQDNTGFRAAETTGQIKGCPFCQGQIEGRLIEENVAMVAIEDGYFMSKWHHPIISRRRLADWFGITDIERRKADDLTRVLKSKLEKEDALITSFNVGFNCGAPAGQTIFHAHIHLNPRRDGDTPNP